jgi:hypothetical protein
MQQTARTDEDIARFQPETAQPEQKPAWERQKQEPARWFLRFQLYRNLGPKRSLRATIAAECEAQPATKGDKQPRQSAARQSEHLSDVSVPGSWSRAAKVWQWKERAQAWDQDQLYQRGKRYQKMLGTCDFASRVTRVHVLNSLSLTAIANLESMKTIDGQVTHIKLIQSLFKQISDEMSVFDGMDTTELDGRVANYISEHAEERKQKQAAKKQRTSAQAEIERRQAEQQELEMLLAALGDRKH